MVGPVELRGKFVWLQPLAREHLEPMRRLAAGPRDTFTWGNVPTVATIEAYLDKALAQAGRSEAVVFATCLPSGELVGCTRLFDLQRWEWPAGADPRPGEEVLDAAEIGYTWLSPRAQRTPVNTEAKLLMLRHAFEAWKCYRVTLKTDERNAQSRAAILRLGAHFDGVLRSFQPAIDGRPRNTAYYSILAAEWPDLQSRLLAKLAR